MWHQTVHRDVLAFNTNPAKMNEIPSLKDNLLHAQTS